MISKRCHSDNKYRKLYHKFEKNKKELKSLFQNRLINSKLRFSAFKKLNIISCNSSISKFKNRCLITGKSKGILRNFKISRIKFREFASNGDISGISKSSWFFSLSTFFYQ
jgi:small subunit ribosomal protein S14